MPDESATTTEIASELGGLDRVSLGGRLRDQRMRRNLSVRALARLIRCSPSLVSQIESERVVPSVSTLYALVRALDVSMDWLFDRPGSARSAPAAGATPQGHSPVMRPHDRPRIELEHGVRWERLTPSDEPGVEFMEVVYPARERPTRSPHAIQHAGRDYAVLLQGQLSVQVGFQKWELGPGDSLAFDGAVPHHFWNCGDEPVRAIFVVLDRGRERL